MKRRPRPRLSTLLLQARARCNLRTISRARFASTRTAPPTSCRAWPASPRACPQTWASPCVAARCWRCSPARPLSEQRSEYLTAQRRLEAARVTLERERKLWQEKISAEQDYLQAQSALREAEIAVANAQQKLAAVGAYRQVRRPEPLRTARAVRRHGGREAPDARRSGQGRRQRLHPLRPELGLGRVRRRRPRTSTSVRVGQRVVVSSTASQTKGKV